jgi:hypothetical protein
MSDQDKEVAYVDCDRCSDCRRLAVMVNVLLISQQEVHVRVVYDGKSVEQMDWMYLKKLKK